MVFSQFFRSFFPPLVRIYLFLSNPDAKLFDKPLNSVADPWHFGTGSGSCYFRQWPSRWHKFFCLLLSEGAFTSYSKIKSHEKSRETVGIKVFLTIFAWWWKDLDPYLCRTNGSGSGSATLLLNILCVRAPGSEVLNSDPDLVNLFLFTSFIRIHWYRQVR